LAAEPNSPRAHLIIYAYSQQGRFDAALEHLQAWEGTGRTPWSRAITAYVYGRLGREAEARQAARGIGETDPSWKGDRLRAAILASIGMRREDEALAGLQEECANHSMLLVDLKVEPAYDPLRGDPRFENLLRCVHLDQGQGEGSRGTHQQR